MSARERFAASGTVMILEAPPESPRGSNRCQEFNEWRHPVLKKYGNRHRESPRGSHRCKGDQGSERLPAPGIVIIREPPPGVAPVQPPMSGGALLGSPGTEIIREPPPGATTVTTRGSHRCQGASDWRPRCCKNTGSNTGSRLRTVTDFRDRHRESPRGSHWCQGGSDWRLPGL